MDWKDLLRAGMVARPGVNGEEGNVLVLCRAYTIGEQADTHLRVNWSLAMLALTDPYYYDTFLLYEGWPQSILFLTPLRLVDPGSSMHLPVLFRNFSPEKHDPFPQR